MSRSFQEWLDLVWAAGIIEGEGSPTINRKNPMLVVKMTDEDIIIRLYNIFKVGKIYKKHPPSAKANKEKPCWDWRVWGNQARGVMKEILPFMGKRRTARIKQLLSGDYRTVKETIDSQKANMLQ